MITPDSSVVIAAFAPWHEAHASARAHLIEAKPQLVAHVALETVSVLSRLPEGHRVAAPLVLDGLKRSFPRPWLSLDGEQTRAAVERAIAAGLRGGALYDALIAATAECHGMGLLSADRRARRTYDALGVQALFVGS